MAHFATFDIATRPVMTDARYYLYFAWQMTEGAVPHLDFFDPKTQLATFVGAFLHALGDLLALDPLLAVRAGYLALAALAGVLVFSVHRRLFDGSVVAGFLGLLAYLSFGFIGALSALGNSPKLLMSILAYLMALCVWKRRWFLAGLCGALAFMDWQIGILVWLSALVAALLLERPRRPACLRLLAGGATGIAPFLAYFALNGALGVALEQTVGSAFSRGSGQLASVGLGERAQRVGRLGEAYFAGREWLLWLSVTGIPCALYRLRQLFQLRRVSGGGAGAAGLLLPLCLYHAGVLAFSALDFQGHGDFLLLLFTASFLLAMVWNLLYTSIASRLPEQVGPRWRVALVAAVLLLALGASRPSLLRPETIVGAGRYTGYLLEDQREVAADLRARSEGRSLLLLSNSELLYLMRHRNPVPTVYWNHAAWSFFREPGEESSEATLGRLLEEAEAEALIYPKRHVSPVPYLERYTPRRLRSRNGKYEAALLVRRPEASHEIRVDDPL